MKELSIGMRVKTKDVNSLKTLGLLPGSKGTVVRIYGDSPYGKWVEVKFDNPYGNDGSNFSYLPLQDLEIIDDLEELVDKRKWEK